MRRFFSLDNGVVKLYHESCAFVPMCCNFGWKAARAKNRFNDTSNESCAIQRAFI